MGNEQRLDLAVIEARGQIMTLTPKESIELATEVAMSCKSIVDTTAVVISGSRHIKIGGWATIANAHNCSLTSRDCKRVEGGFSAIGEVVRRSDGAITGRAEGFCGDDEARWKNQPEYAKRGMAQTRAMSRAAKSAFAYIVVMMNIKLGKDEVKYSSTSAEEMPEQNGNGHAEASGKLGDPPKPVGNAAALGDLVKAKDLAFTAYEIGKLDHSGYDGWLAKINSATAKTLPAMMKTLEGLAK